nr:MAG TPA_asm: Rho termination factor, N-terminal domain [Caudoviricetes sp.]
MIKLRAARTFYSSRKAKPARSLIGRGAFFYAVDALTAETLVKKKLAVYVEEQTQDPARTPAPQVGPQERQTVAPEEQPTAGPDELQVMEPEEQNAPAPELKEDPARVEVPEQEPDKAPEVDEAPEVQAEPEAEPLPPVASMGYQDLKDEAKRRGIKGYQNMKTERLKQVIKHERGEEN